MVFQPSTVSHGPHLMLYPWPHTVVKAEIHILSDPYDLIMEQYAVVVTYSKKKRITLVKSPILLAETRRLCSYLLA